MARKRRRKKQRSKQQAQQKKQESSSGGIPKEEQEEILGRVPAQASFANPPGPMDEEVEVDGDLEGPPPRVAMPSHPESIPPSQEPEVVGRFIHPVAQGLQAGSAQVTQLCEMVDMEGNEEWRDALSDLEQCLTNGYRHTLYILHALAPEEIE